MVVMSVWTIERLSKLGKAIMSASVDAELGGLDSAAYYLRLAFDEVVAKAVRIRSGEVEADVARSVVEAGDGVVES